MSVAYLPAGASSAWGALRRMITTGPARRLKTAGQRLAESAAVINRVRAGEPPGMEPRLLSVPLRSTRADPSVPRRIQRQKPRSGREVGGWLAGGFMTVDSQALTAVVEH